MTAVGHYAEGPPSDAGLCSVAQQGPGGPGLAAVQRIKLDRPEVTTQIVKIIRGHYSERDVIIEWLRDQRGSTFGDVVLEQLGQVERAVPSELKLMRVHAAVSIPAGIKFGGNWAFDATTRSETHVAVWVSTTNIIIEINPGLFLDVTFPGRNSLLTYASFDFATGEATVHASDAGGWGALPTAWIIEGKVRDIIAESVSDSPLATKNYDPTKDPNLQRTLDRVIGGFVGLCGSDDTSEDGAVSMKDITARSLGATVALTAAQSFLADGTGITVDNGAELSISLDGTGNLGTILDGVDKAPPAPSTSASPPNASVPPPAASMAAASMAGNLADVNSIQMHTKGITVFYEGKAIGKVRSMTVARGGVVTIGDLESLGDLDVGKAAESYGSLGLAFMGIGAQNVDLVRAGLENSHRPVLVDTMAKSVMQGVFTQEFHKLVIANRHAVPGVDLAAALGLAEK